MKHEKTYKGSPSGAGQLICSCGWESPSIDDSNSFALGRKQKSLDSYFTDHLIAVIPNAVETTMVDPAPEKAVAPAHYSAPRKQKAKI